MTLAEKLHELAGTEQDPAKALLLREAANTIQRLHVAISTTEHVVTEILGGHLYGYAECDGTPLPCWGDHTAETLAVEAVKRLASYEANEPPVPEVVHVGAVEPWVNAMFTALTRGDTDDATEIVSILAMRRSQMTPTARMLADVAESVHAACMNGADLATL